MLTMPGLRGIASFWSKDACAIQLGSPPEALKLVLYRFLEATVHITHHKVTCQYIIIDGPSIHVDQYSFYLQSTYEEE